MAEKLVVTGLSHDLQAKKSYVSFIWSDDPGKRLGLEVPYGTALDDVAAAARTALDGLARELDASELSLP
ncbi:hypothetical protein VW29_20915 [Devosia limi DSM 17137]|uniref:Uncharacterized protein n=1 Tax=Devosia limi DSM 17137 TaxID=1121477 RepID=A0A0F5L1G9_9HYPH|nr:hypothetical protein [Devosia limi]KKB76208.1 hypothetical protein VW29_20915 [Devosia limi DSM 17137]SHF19178.1 hypothetical protein SAMN02745223_02004 [Devosia limi DSM 17137]